MISKKHRRQIMGALSPMMIAGIVAGVAVVGYLGYKWYKNRQNPTSHSQYAPGYGGAQQRPAYYQQQQQYQPPVARKGYAYAPQSSQRDATGQDPELNRLYAAAQTAQMRFNAAVASGDQSAAASAREHLAACNDALNAKKASMY